MKYQKVFSKNIIHKVLFTSILSVMFVGQGIAEEAHAGKSLIMSAKCMQCHNAKTFYSGKTKMKSLDGLSKQVSRCESNLKVGWFDDELEQATDYLNKKYYKF